MAQGYRDQAADMAEAYEELGSYREVAEMFGCSAMTARKWVKHAKNKGLVQPEPQVTHQKAPDTKTRGMPFFWPLEKKMPSMYHAPRTPCASCRRVHLDNLSQAVVVTHTRDGVAYLLCRACDHRFKLKHKKY